MFSLCRSSNTVCATLRDCVITSVSRSFRICSDFVWVTETRCLSIFFNNFLAVLTCATLPTTKAYSWFKPWLVCKPRFWTLLHVAHMTLPVPTHNQPRTWPLPCAKLVYIAAHIGKQRQARSHRFNSYCSRLATSFGMHNVRIWNKLKLKVLL